MPEKKHLVLITKFVAAREKSPKAALFALKAESSRLLPGNRIGICFHHRLPEREHVFLYYSQEKKRAYYRGLMKCGQQWVCPVCAQRISENRREVLRQGLDNSRDKYVALMVTYTAQHYKGQPLKNLLQDMLNAYRKMRQQRLWRIYKEEYLIVGETRALEITYGDNGWHPHFHVILWCGIELLNIIREPGGTMPLWGVKRALETQLGDMWIEELAKEGQAGLKGIAVNVSSTDDLLNDYVTKGGQVLPTDTSKWGMAEEMTKAQAKKNRRDGKTPWELLIESFCGDRASGVLFKEYAEATKGKSALQWTPGMLDRLKVAYDEQAEAISEEQFLDEIIFAKFDIHDWHKIVETGAIGELLDVASKGDLLRLEDALGVVEKRYTSTHISTY